MVGGTDLAQHAEVKSESSYSLGDGQADWVFSPDKIRGLIQVGVKRYHKEVDQEKIYTKNKLELAIKKQILQHKLEGGVH